MRFVLFVASMLCTGAHAQPAIRPLVPVPGLDVRQVSISRGGLQIAAVAGSNDLYRFDTVTLAGTELLNSSSGSHTLGLNAITDTGRTVFLGISVNGLGRGYRWNNGTLTQITNTAGLLDRSAFPLQSAADVNVTVGVGPSPNPPYFGFTQPFRWSIGGAAYFTSGPGSDPGVRGIGITTDGGTMIWGERARWMSYIRRSNGSISTVSGFRAFAISPDGSKIAGHTSAYRFSIMDTSTGSIVEYWSNGYNGDAILRLVDDGRTAFGTLNNGTDWVWTLNGGMTTFADYLTSRGVDYSGWTAFDVQDVSDDGASWVGVGTYQGQSRAFLVQIPAPGVLVVFTAAIGYVATRRR